MFLVVNARLVVKTIHSSGDVDSNLKGCVYPDIFVRRPNVAYLYEIAYEILRATRRRCANIEFPYFSKLLGVDLGASKSGATVLNTRHGRLRVPPRLPPRKTTGLRKFVYGCRSRTNALNKSLHRPGSRKALSALAEEQTKSEEIDEVELARELKGVSVVLSVLLGFFGYF